MPSFLTRSLGFAAIPAASSLKMQSDDLLPFADHSQSITSPLRRTLSANMASEKWISQSGLKKVASVEHLHFHDNDKDENEAFEDIWSSIQRKQREEEEEEMEKPRLQSSDIWSSILSQKASDQEEEANKGIVAPPYVHPLVKRSASTLSEKSLEICTESLGSETGSEGFSLLAASDHEEMKGEAEAEEETETVEEEVRVSAPIRCAVPVMVQQSVKKVMGGAATRSSFPPPLPSLANRGDGSNVQMKSHRQDGRLVLEAVSVPTHACFRAERQDGRLLLTFSGSHVSGLEAEPDQVVTEQDDNQEEEELMYDEFDEVGDVVEDDEEEEDQESDSEEDEEDDEERVSNNENAMEGYDEFPTQDYNTVVSKFLGLARSWPRRLNKVVNTLDDDEEEEVDDDDMQVGHALNPFVYSWRSKAGPAVVAMSTAAAAQLKGEMGINKLMQVDIHYGKSAVVEVVAKGKTAEKVGEDDVIPLVFKACNLQQQQPKKSLLMWDHRCIAT